VDVLITLTKNKSSTIVLKMEFDKLASQAGSWREHVESGNS